MLTKGLSRFLISDDLKLISTHRYKNGYLWVLEKQRQDFEICPRCANPSSTWAGKAKIRARDELLRGKPIWLEIHKHRYYCKKCKKPFTEAVSLVWPRSRTTQRLKRAVARACEDSCDLSRVRRTWQLSSGFIYNVYYKQLEMRLREYKQRPWPLSVGIDEHFFRRRNGFNEFVTMFTDVGGRRMLDIGLGKNNKSLLEQVAHISGRENVKTVAIDMSGAYKALAEKLFPSAEIVADKFHVLRLLTPAIMKEGKNIHGHRQELSTRRMLLRSRKKLDYGRCSDIDFYLSNHPRLDELYRAKEAIFEFYRIKGRRRAAIAFPKLVARFKNASHEALHKLAKTFIRWEKQILNYFEFGITNAFTEAMNNRGKLVQKRAYGYKSFANYRLRTLSACRL